jgi:hypothetical protein
METKTVKKIWIGLLIFVVIGVLASVVSCAPAGLCVKNSNAFKKASAFK